MVNMKKKQPLTKKELITAEKVGMRKVAMAGLKLYNKLCRFCKIRTINIQRRGGRVKMKDYCPACKLKAEKYLGGLK